MTKKTDNPIDTFVENSKKNRIKSITPEELKIIQDLVDDANKEEAYEDGELPLVAKTNETQLESQL